MEARQPNKLLGTIIPFASVGLVAANSLLGYSGHELSRPNERWFQSNTRDGGADKASHFADYYIVAKEVAFVYEKIGYSENAARWFGFGVAVTTGLANEVSDGFTRHGFSWQDLAMDARGAAAAVLVSMTRTEDLLGVRTSHIPGDTYTHDVYSADLKLVGLERRLGIKLGPLRWLNFSVTYGTKGYRVTPETEHAAPDRPRDRPEPSADPERRGGEAEHVVGLCAPSRGRQRPVPLHRVRDALRLEPRQMARPEYR